MLYHLHELKKMAMWPTHLWSEMASSLLKTHDLEHENTCGRLLKAYTDVFERNTRIYKKPEFGIHNVIRDEKTLSVHESVFIRKSFCNLVRFDRIAEDDATQKSLHTDPVTLLVAPLSGHYATLLRGTAEAMIPHHQTYITDWIDTKTVPLSKGSFNLDDYVSYLLEFIRALYSYHGSRPIHIVAVCQPSVPVLVAVSILAELNDAAQPSTMTLMGGPIDTRINPGQVNEFATSHNLEWFKQNLISRVPNYYPGKGQLVCPGFILLNGFMSLNPVRHQQAFQELFQHMVEGDMDSVTKHEKFYDEYRAVMDVPGEYFLDSMYHAFQAHSLPKGEMTWQGMPVNTHAIQKTALLTVEGERDDISCPGQTLAAHDLCPNIPKRMQKTYLQKGVGHYGVFNGQRWRRYIQPKIAEFIRKHDHASYVLS